MIINTHHDDMAIGIAAVLVSARADFMHYHVSSAHEFHVKNVELHETTKKVLTMMETDSDGYVRIQK